MSEQTQVCGGGLTRILDDLRSPEHQPNPYPYYHRLREQAPIYQAAPGIWLLSRHRDCSMAFKDKPFTQPPQDSYMCLPDRTVPGEDTGEDTGAAHDDSHNPRYLRPFLAQYYSPRVMRSLQPRIQQIVDEIVGRAIEAREVDLVAAVAEPLTSQVICETFGVPPADGEFFRRCAARIVPGFNLLVDSTADSDDTGAHTARMEFREYLRRAIAERRRRPGDDALSALIAYDDRGGQLPEEKLLDACITILIASIQGATVEFLSLAALALAEHPQEWDRLCRDPGIADTALEELLRYDSPGQILPRMALHDVQVDGHPVRRGEIVLLMLGAANRDPDVFPEPDRLDLTRDPNPHLSWGYGPHFCVGAPLARMELQLALATLAARAPGLRVGEPQWADTVDVRRPIRLPVALP